MKKRLLRILPLLVVLVILILGFFAGRYLYRNVFGRVDVVLDAGHGGKDSGAIGGDVNEKDINLSIAKTTREILKESGYKVKMIRNTDRFLELTKRSEIANQRKAKVYVSIHCNSSESGEGKGIETFYTEQKEETDQELAKQIQKAVIKRTEASDRGVKTANFTVLVTTNMPAALVETGFLTNETERERLQESDYQEKIARGIAEGIVRYLENKEN